MTKNDPTIGFVEIADHTEAYNYNGKKKSLSEALEDDIREALKRIKKHRGKATIEIKLDLVQGADNEVFTSSSIKQKLPQPKVLPTSFYSDNKGNLYMEDPEQLSLFDNKVTKIGGAK